MNENQWLFLWRSPTSGFCVKDICYSGPRAVLCCLTNGRISKLAEIDPHVSKQTAQYEFNEGSAIVCVTCARGNNRKLQFLVQIGITVNPHISKFQKFWFLTIKQMFGCLIDEHSVPPHTLLIPKVWKNYTNVEQEHLVKMSIQLHWGQRIPMK